MFLTQDPRARQQSRHKSNQTITEHLPWRPRSLTEDDIANDHRKCPTHKAIAVIMMIPAIGLNEGAQINATLETTAIVVSTASIARYLAFGFFPSKLAKNGTIAKIMMITLAI